MLSQHAKIISFERTTVLFVCSLILVCHNSYAQDTIDSQRKLEVARVITALESYASANDSYTVSGGGHQGKGIGWLNYSGGTYPSSIAGVLADLGFLSSPLPNDPQQPSDFMVYRCRDRVAVFSKADSILPDSNDASWWQNNGCTRLPIDNYNRTYFALSEPVSAVSYDSLRVSEVARVITALESYASANDSYTVSGGGHQGKGIGWLNYSGGTYPSSIAGVLADLGFLSSPLPNDPQQPSDFMVYRCRDRVAVFSKADSILPDSNDASWWQNNGCTRLPIDNYNRTYFALSEPVSAVSYDSLRVSEVARVITALESYASANDSYTVSGGGHQGKGIGWLNYSGGTYPSSIAGVLADLGFLSSPLPNDPQQPSDFMVYRCRDRVAVFSKADSILPDSDDASWWQNNGCTRLPIDNYNRTYFAVSDHLNASSTIVNLADYTLIFEDNFDGSSLDPAKWDTGMLWGPYWNINNEEQLYVDTLGMHEDFAHSPFEFTGSTLKITATPTSSSLQPPVRPPEGSPLFRPRPYSEYRYNDGYNPDNVNYLSGTLTTYDSLKIAHGYVEMRAKLPSGKGLLPSLWMPTTHYLENAPEIDIVEFYGDQTDSVYHSYHYFDINNTQSYVSTPQFATFSSDWTQDFNTFGMAWSPTEMIWYVNGIETRRITSDEYVMPNQSLYLVASLAVGGNWAQSPDASTVFPATMEIDYIRAYERKLNPELDLANDYQLMFEDEFEGSALDANKWKTAFLWGPYLPINQEEQYLVDALGSDADLVTLANTPFVLNDGILSIIARRKDDPNSFPIPDNSEVLDANANIWTEFPSYQRNTNYVPGNYTSGLITSYNSFKFVHGYIETRAKIPTGQGMWPSFWLLNAYYVGPQPEVDIFEILGNDSRISYHTFHRPDELGAPFQTQGYTQYGAPGIGYSDDFHIYGLRWQRGRLDWYIDGTLVYTYEGEDVPYQMMYVLADVAVGGSWPGPPFDNTQFPVSLDIDYIRVYQERSKE